MIRVVIENILLFLLPAAVYLAYMLLMRSDNTSAGAVVNDAPLVWLFVAGALLVAATLIYYATDHARRLAGADLHAPAHGQGRAHRARPAEVAHPAWPILRRPSELPSLAGADWLARPETRAVFDALAAGGFAGPCGRRRRAQRAAGPAGGRHRHRHPGAPRAGDGGGAGCRPRCSADRRRTRHRHGDRQPRRSRGDDAARGRRDARPPRHGRLHRRLGGGRAPARLHDQRALLQRRRRGVRPAGRARPTSRRVACASSARHGSASARTTCASCASSG